MSLSPVPNVENQHSPKILIQWAPSPWYSCCRSSRNWTYFEKLPLSLDCDSQLWLYIRITFAAFQTINPWASLPEILTLHIWQGAQVLCKSWKSDSQTSQSWESLLHSSGLQILLSICTVEINPACICSIVYT